MATTENTVNLTDKVSVRGVKGAKHLTGGKVYEVHPLLAKRLIANKQAEAVK